jgi:hypothetical protein
LGFALSAATPRSASGARRGPILHKLADHCGQHEVRNLQAEIFLPIYKPNAPTTKAKSRQQSDCDCFATDVGRSTHRQILNVKHKTIADGARATDHHFPV